MTTPAITGGFLTPGVAKISSEAVTPRAVATWLPSRNFTAYASYSQGFRAGLTQMPLVLTVAPIPPIKSDTINNFEIGTKGNLFGGLLSFDIAAYYIKWTNVQTAVTLFYGPPGAQGTVAALVNGSSASGFGTDISLALEPAQGLQIGDSLSINDLKVDGPIVDRGVVLYNTGDRLAFSAKYTAAGYLSYDFPLTDSLTGKFKMTVDYRSKQYQRTLGAAVGNNVNLRGCGRSGANSVC